MSHYDLNYKNVQNLVGGLNKYNTPWIYTVYMDQKRLSTDGSI